MGNPPPIPPRPPQVPQPLPYAAPHVGTGVPCPKCGQYAGKPVKFTSWGGVIGPKILHHHRCDACGYTFNSKTGQPNTTGIVIYTVGVLVIVGTLLLLGALA